QFERKRNTSKMMISLAFLRILLKRFSTRSDRDGASAMLALNCEHLQQVKSVLVDGGYTGDNFAATVQSNLKATVQVAKRNELHKFEVLPQRWIIERSFSLLDKCRRLWKNCERHLNSSRQMIILAFLILLLKRF
ncbi:transposase, partial [Lactiplantibacillus plantarum]|uniref:transposase n=1 Tax=Lactiplantibacillus plantarum TaxID=1590 RepID=UPI003C1D1EA8